MAITSPKELANHLKTRRDELGLSQAKLANKVGIKQTTVSSFELKPESTKIQTLFRMLAALNLEIQITDRNESSDKKKWDAEW
jgi:HTH-type transcriptional regulator/antitoxin HipB